MRSPSILCAALILGIFTIPSNSASQTAASPRVRTPAAPVMSRDSIRHFLLTSAATDFHTHGPKHIIRFRDVRIGHCVYSGGEERDLLTGQFLHANASSKEEWTPFVTIKTSGYEQWIGAEAETFTRGSSVVWDTTGELSKALQDLLASLK